jgi:cytochrome P450
MEPMLRNTNPNALATWVLTRYDDVREVMGNNELFSSAIPLRYAPPGLEIFIQMDPPDHTRIRRSLTPWYTVRRVAMQNRQVADLVHALLDGLESSARRECDLTKHFSDPLAYSALCQFLGLPTTHREFFDRWLLTFEDSAAPPAHKKRAGEEMMRYLRCIINATGAPEGSLLSHLQSALKRSADPGLTEHELACIFFTLMSAGYETLRNMVSLSLLTLIVRPDLAKELRDSPDLIPAAVDELARYYSVVHRPLPRVVTQDTVIHGQHLRAGECVSVSLPAANWDEKYFEKPEEINFKRRSTVPPISFGHGIHHCLGRALASSVLKSVIEITQERMPRLHLAPQQETIQFTHDRKFYGVSQLSVVWR